MKVMIVGCGRVGAGLALQFDREGHEVVIIDIRVAAFGRLGKGFGGRAEVGNGMDESVLRRFGIETVDAFASVTSGDNRNLMAAQIAKAIFHVPRVITRIYDPIREQAFHELGLETICSTTISMRLIHDFFEEGVNKARTDPVLAATGA